MSRKIFLLPGDGIGIEVMREAKKFISFMNKELNFGFTCEEGLVGGSAYDVHRRPISENDMNHAISSDAILFGSVGGPKWESVSYDLRPEAALLRLRNELELFANLRPCICYPSLIQASPLKPDLVSSMNILIVRELTGGIYFGTPKEIITLKNGEKRAIDTQIYETSEIKRIAHIAFQISRTRKQRVTSIEKRNVMKTGFLWNEVVNDIHQLYYDDVFLNHMLADSGSMQIVKNPKQFDVILTDNLFGDILSDIAAILTGSLGILPSASLGDQNNIKKCRAMYEPAHGSAPDIAGKGIANPIGMIASFAMCLRYSFKLDKEAKLIEQAISEVLDDGFGTQDLISSKIKKISTNDMGDAILNKFKILIEKL